MKKIEKTYVSCEGNDVFYSQDFNTLDGLIAALNRINDEDFDSTTLEISNLDIEPLNEHRFITKTALDLLKSGYIERYIERENNFDPRGYKAALGVTPSIDREVELSLEIARKIYHKS